MQASTHTVPQDVDTLIEDLDFVVTVDPDRRITAGASIAISDGRIVAIEPADDLRSTSATTRMSGRGRMAIPGMVDGHLHTSFALSRGLADECGAKEFLLERMYRYEDGLAPEDVRLAAELATAELLLHGVTTFIDPGNTASGESRAAADAVGIRSAIARSTFDIGTSGFGTVPAGLVQTTDEALAASQEDLESVPKADRSWPTLSFRGVNNASDALIVGLNELAVEADVTLQTHAAFSYSTRDASWDKHGKGEVQRLYDLGALGPNTFIVHGGWLNAGEVELLASTSASVVVSPSSSLHNAYGNLLHGRHWDMLERGIHVGLGSDHASSGMVDMVREAHLLCGAIKERTLDAKAFPPELALEAATIHGAAIAGRPDLGRLVVDGPADIVLIDTDRPEMQPLFNPVSNLIYSGSGALVSDVWVAGDRVVDAGQLVQVDFERIIRQVRDFTADALANRDFGTLIRSRWL